MSFHPVRFSAGSLLSLLVLVQPGLAAPITLPRLGLSIRPSRRCRRRIARPGSATTVTWCCRVTCCRPRRARKPAFPSRVSPPSRPPATRATSTWTNSPTPSCVSVGRLARRTLSVMTGLQAGPRPPSAQQGTQPHRCARALPARQDRGEGRRHRSDYDPPPGLLRPRALQRGHRKGGRSDLNRGIHRASRALRAAP